MDNLHLFEDAKTFKPVLEQKYLVIAEYAGLQFDCFAKWQAFGSYEHWFILSGVHYQGDQPTITHVLDLSKLTTKDKAGKAIEKAFDHFDNHIEEWKGCEGWPGYNSRQPEIDKLKSSL